MRLPREIVQEEKNPRLHPGQLQHTRTAQQERLGGNRQSVGKSWGGARSTGAPRRRFTGCEMETRKQDNAWKL